jgi:hypothetical protein
MHQARLAEACSADADVSSVRRTGLKPAYSLFAVVLGAYAYFFQAGGWNQNTRLDLTRAIVEQQTLRIDAYADNTGDLAEKDGHEYCDKAPGLSWMAVPPYAAVHSIVSLGTAGWLITVLAVALPSALACVLFSGLLMAWGVRAGPAYATAAAWALATLAWPYGTLFYGHQTAASLLVGAFSLVAAPRVRGELVSAARMAAAGGLFGWSVVVEYPALLACAAIAAYTVWAHGWRRSVWIAAGAALPLVALAAYHWSAFGSPFTMAYSFSIQGYRSQGFFMGIGVPKLQALWGILFSSYRGLFYSAPWLVFAAPGAVRLWGAGRRAEVIACSVIVFLFVWLNASLVDWNGGWAMGPRYLVPCLPFLALLAGGMFAGRVPRALLIPITVLVAYSFVAMLAGTAVKPEVDLKVKTPFASFIYPHFFRGELAASTQSFNDLWVPKNASRQAWNLGERLGLSGLTSLLPLMLWCCVWGALLVAGVRVGKDRKNPGRRDRLPELPKSRN